MSAIGRRKTVIVKPISLHNALKYFLVDRLEVFRPVLSNCAVDFVGVEGADRSVFVFDQTDDVRVVVLELRRVRRRPDDVFLLELEHCVLSPAKQDALHDFDLPDGFNQRHDVEFFLKLVSANSVVSVLPEFDVAFDLDGWEDKDLQRVCFWRRRNTRSTEWCPGSRTRS